MSESAWFNQDYSLSSMGETIYRDLHDTAESSSNAFSRSGLPNLLIVWWPLTVSMIANAYKMMRPRAQIADYVKLREAHCVIEMERANYMTYEALKTDLYNRPDLFIRFQFLFQLFFIFND